MSEGAQTNSAPREVPIHRSKEYKEFRGRLVRRVS